MPDIQSQLVQEFRKAFEGKWAQRGSNSQWSPHSINALGNHIVKIIKLSNKRIEKNRICLMIRPHMRRLISVRYDFMSLDYY